MNLVKSTDKPLDRITDHDDLLFGLLHLLEQSETHAEPFIREEQDNYGYFLGKQNYKNRSQAQILKKDMIEQTISDIVPLLTRSKPFLNIKAKHEASPALYYNVQRQPNYLQGNMTDGRVAEVFTEVMRGLWNTRAEKVRQHKLCQRALIAGVAFDVYSLRRDPYRGDVPHPKTVAREQVLLDPNCTDLIEFTDAKYAFIKTTMSAHAIEERWGLKEYEYGGGGDGVELDTSQVGLVRRRWMDNPEHPKGEKKPTYESPEYEVHECYYNPNLPEIIGQENMGEAEGTRDNRNPHGKRYIIVNRKVIVEGRSDKDVFPYWHGKFPVVCYVPQPISGLGHGYSLVTKLRDTQDFVNILFNTYLKNVQLNSGTQWMAEKGTIRKSDFRMIPNGLIPVEKDALRLGRLKQIPPGNLGREVYETIYNEIGFGKEQIGDVTPAIQGVQGSNIKSAKHARTALESANTKFAEMIGLLDAAYERAADIEVSMMQQFADFTSPSYQVEELITEELAMAMRDLIYSVAVQSKSMFPAQGVAQSFEYHVGMLDRGLYTLKMFYQLTDLWDTLPPEMRTKVEQADQNWIPGISPQEAAAQIAAARQEMSGLAGELGGMTGIQPTESEGGGTIEDGAPVRELV